MLTQPIDINNISCRDTFLVAAQQIYEHQLMYCKPFRTYTNALKRNNAKIKSIADFTFLPIGFFKTHVISTNDKTPSFFFESSGTGGNRSKHFFNSAELYEKSFNLCFRLFYGEPANWIILALLPSYAANPHASLIYMSQSLIKQSNNIPDVANGFYHERENELYKTLLALQNTNKPVMLLGVSYALLDFVSKYPLDFPSLTVIETGGMKGRRRELTRNELHGILQNGFGLKHIHSEYGMTELFSQAWAQSNGIFRCPPWMKVLVRDISDPFCISETGSGALNIIDLANQLSCAFIETEDLGTVFPDGSFSVNGRIDNTQMRGCNLLIT